ncbi:MAG: hypothetical protein PHC62_00595 [Candidatus Izemoplasmatales bacterium]|nr:hypothetical protein [Candidatus Izemoplasmatales bacterium]
MAVFDNGKKDLEKDIFIEEDSIKNIENAMSCSVILGETHNLMEFVVRDEEMDLSILVHFEQTYDDDFYIKIINSCKMLEGTKCCRVKMSKPRYKKRPSDDIFSHLELTVEQKEWLVKTLKGYCPKYGDRFASLWMYIIKEHIKFTDNEKNKKKLRKMKNRMPDYALL